MSQSLLDKRVVVTGGFGALGSALGKFLLARGARVALLDRSEAPAALLDTENLLCLGGVDLTSSESASAAFEQVAGHLGGIDGLVNVAGGFAWETVEGGSLLTWDRLYQMNVRTAVVSSQSALPTVPEPRNSPGYRVSERDTWAITSSKLQRISRVLPRPHSSPLTRATMFRS